MPRQTNAGRKHSPSGAIATTPAVRARAKPAEASADRLSAASRSNAAASRAATLRGAGNHPPDRRKVCVVCQLRPGGGRWRTQPLQPGNNMQIVAEWAWQRVRHRLQSCDQWHAGPQAHAEQIQRQRQLDGPVLPAPASAGRLEPRDQPTRGDGDGHSHGSADRAPDHERHRDAQAGRHRPRGQPAVAPRQPRRPRSRLSPRDQHEPDRGQHQRRRHRVSSAEAMIRDVQSTPSASSTTPATRAT